MVLVAPGGDVPAHQVGGEEGMSNQRNDFGDLNAASGGNPALRNFLSKLADAQNLANIGANSLPRAASSPSMAWTERS
jgi:hypothetical protein